MMMKMMASGMLLNVHGVRVLAFVVNVMGMD